jgi:hypothetical protein
VIEKLTPLPQLCKTFYNSKPLFCAETSSGPYIMRPAPIHRYHATCLNVYGVVSRNWSQYQLVSRQVAVSRRSPYTMIPCNWDRGNYQRVWGGLETTNSLAASLLWITTKWIPIASFWEEFINIYRLHSETISKCVSAWYRDTSLMKPRSRDKSHSVWPALLEMVKSDNDDETRWA